MKQAIYYPPAMAMRNKSLYKLSPDYIYLIQVNTGNILHVFGH